MIGLSAHSLIDIVNDHKQVKLKHTSVVCYGTLNACLVFFKCCPFLVKTYTGLVLMIVDG